MMSCRSHICLPSCHLQYSSVYCDVQTCPDCLHQNGARLPTCLPEYRFHSFGVDGLPTRPRVVQVAQLKQKLQQVTSERDLLQQQVLFQH